MQLRIFHAKHKEHRGHRPRRRDQAGGLHRGPEPRLLLPAMALAEAGWAIRKGKSAVTVSELRDAIALDARLSVLPLDDELVYAADALGGELEMHDRLIVATAARE